MAPVLFGFPNLFAGSALRVTSGPLDDLLEDTDVVLVREPWQVPFLLKRSDVPVVYSSHNVEIDRFDRMNPPLYGIVRNRVRELERRAVEESAATVCTSERDAEMYRERFDADSPLIVAPNGTSRSNLRERDSNSDVASALREEYGIDSSTTVAMFVGSDYGPNVEAAEHVVRIADRLAETSPPIHFLLVGTVGESVNIETSNVTVTGFVEEFEGHFDLADIALNPMTTGGGTNIKVFDYFARGLPVVSTPFGVRGIDVEDGEEVFLAAIDEFAETLKRLRFEPEHRARVGAAARRLTEEKYTWEDISENLHDRLVELVH